MSNPSLCCVGSWVDGALQSCAFLVPVERFSACSVPATASCSPLAVRRPGVENPPQGGERPPFLRLQPKLNVDIDL